MGQPGRFANSRLALAARWLWRSIAEMPRGARRTPCDASSALIGANSAQQLDLSRIARRIPGRSRSKEIWSHEDQLVEAGRPSGPDHSELPSRDQARRRAYFEREMIGLMCERSVHTPRDSQVRAIGLSDTRVPAAKCGVRDVNITAAFFAPPARSVDNGALFLRESLAIAICVAQSCSRISA